MNIEQVRQMDCREVARRLMGEPVSQNARLAMYRAPHRDDGKKPSFAVYADGWKDFGGSGEAGDVIALVELVQGVDFKGAMAWFGADVNVPMTPPPTPPRNQGGESRRRSDDPPEMGWQAAAMDVVVQAQRTLWSERGARAMAYLREKRGLKDETIHDAQMGYIPGGPQSWETMEGLNVPCGILIPWVIDGEVWQLKVRRAAGSIKYQQVKGGSAGGLYLVDQVQQWQDVLITEGEFDALVVKQATRVLAPVALGSASNTLRERWLNRLVLCGRLYARLDKDEAGQASLERLQGMSGRVQPVQVPGVHKDINDFYMADAAQFHAWVRSFAGVR